MPKAASVGGEHPVRNEGHGKQFSSSSRPHTRRSSQDRRSVPATTPGLTPLSPLVRNRYLLPNKDTGPTTLSDISPLLRNKYAREALVTLHGSPSPSFSPSSHFSSASTHPVPSPKPIMQRSAQESLELSQYFSSGGSTREPPMTPPPIAEPTLSPLPIQQANLVPADHGAGPSLLFDQPDTTKKRKEKGKEKAQPLRWFENLPPLQNVAGPSRHQHLFPTLAQETKAQDAVDQLDHELSPPSFTDTRPPGVCVRQTEDREEEDSMEEDARYRYQGKHYRARSSRASDYHSDKLEISQEKDEADSPAGNGRFYRAQQSRGSDIHPDGLPGTFQRVQGEASDFEAEDYEADYEDLPARDSPNWEDFKEYFKQLFQKEIRRLSIKEEINTLTKVVNEGFASLASQNSQSTMVYPEAGPFPRRRPKERGLPVRRTPEENAFNDGVRKHFLHLIGGKGNLGTRTVAPAEALAFVGTLNVFGEETRGPCCTEELFMVDLQQPHSAWNQSAARVFASSFIHFHDLPNSDRLYDDLVKGFFVRVKSLRRDHLMSMKDPKQVAQRRRRDGRKIALYERRLRTCMGVPGLNKHIQIIKRFGVAGMSSDESDYEEARVNPAIAVQNPVYRILLPKFRESTSGKLRSFFRFIDRMNVLERRSDGPSRGDLPRRRKHVKASPRYSQRDISVNNLPVNAYDANWLSKRSLIRPTPNYDFSHDFTAFDNDSDID